MRPSQCGGPFQRSLNQTTTSQNDETNNTELGGWVEQPCQDGLARGGGVHWASPFLT